MAETINPFRQILEALRGFIHTDSFYKLCEQTIVRKLLFSLIVGVLDSFIIYFGEGIRIISGEGVDNLTKTILLFVLEIPIEIIILFFVSLLWSFLGIVINAVKKSNASFTTIYWIGFYMQAEFMIFSAVWDTFFSYSLEIIFVIIYICVISKMLGEGLPPDMRDVIYGEDFMTYVGYME